MIRVVSLVVTSLGELRARWPRTLLSCLSLILGILSVIAIQMTSTVAEQAYIHDAELQQGRNGSAHGQLDGSVENRLSVRKLLHNLPGAAALTYSTGAYVVADSGTPVNVVGYAGDLINIFPYDTSSTVQPGEVILNTAAAGVLGHPHRVRYLDAGDTVYQYLSAARVVDDRDGSAAVLVPEHLLAPIDDGASIEVYYVDPGRDGDAAKQSLRFSLKQVGLSADLDTVDVVTSIRNQIKVLRLAFLIAAAITLLVGVIGIVNLELVALKTRVEELALRRSLGARKTDIRLLVLFDGLVIGLAGSIIAIAISVVVFRPAAQTLIPGNHIGYPVSAAALGVAAGVLAGLLGGLVPALRAGSIQIAVVMRA